MPVSITVEPANVCNLRCVECPIGQAELTRAGGRMSLQLFESVLQQTYKSLINSTLYFQGEPFLNNELFSMIAYAHAKKVYTVVSTNGHFLTDDICEKIIDSKLDRLIISFDGFDQESYSSYRKGGDIDKVKMGIENIILWRNKSNVHHPLIVLQTLVLKTNEHQLSDINKFAKSISVDMVSLKTAQLYNYKNGHELMPINEKFSRYKKISNNSYKLKKTITNKCWRMWSSSVIAWNGTVVPCCYDKDAHYKMGDMLKNDFHFIWKGVQYSEFRKQLITNRKQIGICTNCNE